jgi:hypothetical protein
LADLDKVTKRVLAEMEKEMNSTNARLQRMLQEKVPGKPENGAFKGIDKKL